MKRYNPKDIEPKWQKTWQDQGTYVANLNSDKPKYIGMSMLNYPSGAGIHIGHAMNYTISDVMARYKRQQGFESYHPVGWDAFGLPAENYAIKSGVSPQASMAKIIPDYHKQYKAMGWSNDWSKEISTHEPRYYKWTQWIFSQMYKNGLAYQDSRMQWWCTKCQTVLANEQVIESKCWRHDSPDDPLVEKKEVKQWFFKITEYADELLEATDALDWSEVVKTAQKNWIGKSKGAEVDFAVVDSEQKVKVFTTRPDTLFGATFLVLAPEHELIEQIVSDEQRTKVDEYIKDAEKKTEVERQASKDKSGVFTGAYAINPATEEKIPVWIADYVLVGYGTGAIMAVPAHDQRDFEFAQAFNLKIVPVVAPVHIDDIHPAKPDQPFEARVAAQMIVKHPAEEKFLLLKLKGWTTPTYSLPIGGVDATETAAQAAVRELREETGFSDIGDIKQVSMPYVAVFYHELKKVNRRATIHTFSAQLKSLTRENVNSEEQEKHDLEWRSIDEVHDMLHGQGVQMMVDNYRKGGEVIAGEGEMINSGAYDGISSSDARERIVADLSAKGVATEKVNYKIRDWSVSRQRYWGSPIPIVHCPKDGAVLVPDEQLPVILPELTDFQPSGDGRSALARATDWLQTTCPTCEGPAERETDTLDTYICSSWYMLRYLDPDNDTEPFNRLRVNKWMPIDFYNGGDHATAHMIYARFITRFFYKLGMLDNPEPFKRFLFNGKVTASDGQMFSKSKGNGVDPLEIIEQGYGADALRTYLMFAAPLDLWMRWDPQGVPGTYRFLSRVWNLVQDFNEKTDKTSGDADTLLRIIHPAILKVTKDIEEQKYNTAIAAMMKATNDLYEHKAKKGIDDSEAWQLALEYLVMLLAPFAPHIAEELWQQLRHNDSIHINHWPKLDESYLVSETMKLAVQVNGKVRAEIVVNSDTDEESIKSEAMSQENVQTHIAGKEIKKIIYVKNRLVSIVV